MEKELIFWLVLMVVLLVIELITVGLTSHLVCEAVH